MISAQTAWNSLETQSAGWKVGENHLERKQAFLASESLDKKVDAAPGAVDLDPGHRLSGVHHSHAKQQEMQTTMLDRNGFYERYSGVD